MGVRPQPQTMAPDQQMDLMSRVLSGNIQPEEIKRLIVAGLRHGADLGDDATCRHRSEHLANEILTGRIQVTLTRQVQQQVTL